MTAAETPKFLALKSLLTSLAVLIGTAIGVRAEILAYEPFDYPVASQVAHGGLGFFEPYSTPIDVADGNLTFGTLPVFGNSLVTAGTGVPTFRGLDAPLPDGYGAPGSTIYLSFLVGNVSGTEGGWGGVSLFDGNVEELFVGKPSNISQWGIDTHNAGQRIFGSGVPVDAQTRLLVVRIDFGGLGELLRFYLDPPLGAEPAEADIGPLFVDNFTFDRLRITAGNFGESEVPVFHFDEILLSDSYDEIGAPKPTEFPIRWTGAGDGTTWEDGGNWSGLAVPGPADAAEIDLAGNLTVSINSAVTVASLACAEELVVAGGSLAVVDGESIISGPFTLQAGTSLTADGNGTVLTVTGAASIDDASVFAVNRATLSLPTVISYTQTANTILRANNRSLLIFPNLTSIAGAVNGSRVDVEATNSGRVQMPALVTQSGYVNFRADGEITEVNPSMVEIPALTAFDGGPQKFGYLWATNSGDLVTPALAAVHNGRIILSESSSIDTSELSDIDDAGIVVSDGATLDLPLVTSYTTTSTTSLEAINESSLLSLPNLTTFAGPAATNSLAQVRARMGGRVEMPALVTQSGFVRIEALGVSPEFTPSTIDLASLTAFNGFRGFGAGWGHLKAADGAVLLTPSLAEVHDAILIIDGPGSIDVSALANIDDAGIELSGGATLSLPLVTSYTTTIPSLFLADGAGTELSLPNLASATETGSGTLTFRTLDNGTILLPALRSFSFGAVFDDAGGTISFPIRIWIGEAEDGAWEDPDNWRNGIVPGAGDDVQIPAAGNDTPTINSAVSLASIVADTDLIVSSPGSLTLTDGNSSICEFTLDPGTSLTATGAGTYLLLGGGLNFDDVSIFALDGAFIEETDDSSRSHSTDTVIRASGAGSRISFASLTTLTGNANGARLDVEALDGGTLDFPSLTSPTQNVRFTADGAGSQLRLPSLVSFDGVSDSGGWLAATGGGELLTPDLASVLGGRIIFQGYDSTMDLSALATVNDTTVTVDSASPEFEALTNLDNSSVFATSFSQVSFPLLTSYTGSDLQGLLAATEGDELDFPLLASITGPTNGGALGVGAYGGGRVNMPALVSQTGEVFFESGGSGLEYGASRIDLSSLAAYDGLSFRFGGLSAYNGGSILTPLLAAFNNGSLFLDGSSSIDTTLLADIDDANIFVSGGASLTLPLVTTYTSTDTSSLDATGAGTLLSLPNLAIITGPDDGSLFVQAVDGGQIDLPLLQRRFGNFAFNASNGGTINYPEFPDRLWTGLGDGVSWDDPANWSFDLLPDDSDNVTVEASGEVLLFGFEEINSLHLSSGQLIVSDGGLTTYDPSRVSGEAAPPTAVLRLESDSYAEFYDGLLFGAVEGGDATLEYFGGGMTLGFPATASPPPPGFNQPLSGISPDANDDTELPGEITWKFFVDPNVSFEPIYAPDLLLETVSSSVPTAIRLDIVPLDVLQIGDSFTLVDYFFGSLAGRFLDTDGTVFIEDEDAYTNPEGYEFRIDYDDFESITATVVGIPGAIPVITQQPLASQFVPAGGTADLSVTATGDPAPELQWYEGLSGDTSNPVPDATAASLTTPPISASTSFWVRASNQFGSIDSESAEVIVVQFSNALLGDLSPSTGDLAPPFSGFITDYAVVVSNDTTSLVVTPEAQEPAATITVNGASVPSGDPSGPIPLQVGANTIAVIVTAVDGVTTQAYTVDVTRVAPTTAATGSVTNLTDVSAVLNGSVIPNGDVDVYFQYGTDTSYGLETEIQFVSGPGIINLLSPIAGLTGGVTYHYRIVTMGPNGSVVGNDATFTTLPDPPVAATGNAVGVTANTATLVGAVDPRGLETKYFFEYGTTNAFGSQTPEETIPAGTFGLTNVSAEVGGLEDGQTYRFRLVAMSVNGMANQGQNDFTAGGGSGPGNGVPTAPPTVVTDVADLITSASATMKATVNAKGGTTVVRYEYGTTTANLGQVTGLQGIGSADQDVLAAIPATNLLPGTRYFFRPVATNSLGATPGSMGVFTTKFAPPVVQTGPAIALTTTSVQVRGAVRARSPSAQVTVEYGTDGITFPFSVSATPATVSGSLLRPVEAVLPNLVQGTTYFYRVRAVTGTPPDSVAGVGATRSFQVASLSGLFQSFPPPVPPGERSGAVQVTLAADGGLGAWRFVGEVLWRESGESATGLTTGDRSIEFRPVPGAIQPPVEAVAVISGTPPVNLVRAYTPAATGSGALTVLLKPDSLANPANPVESRAQWRILGETNVDWKDTGTTLSGLVPGDYVIESKPVAGRTTPSPVTTQVTDGNTTVATVTYFLAEQALGRLPRALTFGDVSVTEVLPYPFGGQLRSDAGLSTGFVVRPKVVATVGHAVFDDGTLAAATGLEWRFQQQAGVHQPVPQIPRGFYLLTGYEAQRAADNSPGTSTPQSQTLDAATLYFPAAAGRGGFSGFLASDAVENEFLVSSAPMTLVGYPIDGTTGANVNKMHATPIGGVTFTAAFGETYTTSDLSSTGGNSGGPLCVLHPTGSYYPAAIYLGGTAQTVVRAIDSDIVNLIGFAEASGDADFSNEGGMITNQVVTNISPAVLGSLRVLIEPAAARAAGAGWRINSQNEYRASGVRVDDLSPNVYGLDFATVTGFQPPATPAVTVNGGELLTVTFTYEEIVPPPVITSSSEIIAKRGDLLNFQIEAGFAESYSVLGPLPAGVSINPDTGLISGTLEEAGRFVVTVNAVNSGGADSKPLAIISAPTVTLVPPTVTIPVNTPVNVQATTGEIGPGLVFGVQGLPSGLSFDPATGLLTGAPNLAGEYLIPITVTKSNATGVANLTLNVTGEAPAITRQPSATRDVEFGLTTTLSVKATGTPPPGYQWFEVDGTTATLIDGATFANFTTPPIMAPVKYKVRVQSISGTVDSSLSQILVLPSTNPNLADLVVDAVLFEPVLSPRFNPSIASYTTTVPNFVSGVTITPTPQIAQSSVDVTPAGDPVPLVVGDNLITVAVTAGDGVSTRNYDVTVTRSPAPTQQTDAVTDITDVSATLNGTVVPNGSAAVFFQYGLLGEFSDSTSPVFLEGSASLPVQAALMDLTGGTDYQFRLAIQTPGGTTFGPTGSFTTLTPRPLTAVGTPAGVTTAQATFIGAVDPQGRDFEVYFEWGLDNSYDNTTPPQQVLAVNGIQEVTATVTGLIEGREYCYRLVAAQGGQVFTVSQAVAFISTTVPGGSDGMADAPPTVTTGGVANVTPVSATLLGSVNPNDGTTFVRFEYGLTTAYGRSTVPQGFGNGVTARDFLQDLEGLVPGTLYHYRIAASNSLGTTRGSDQTFVAGFLPPVAATGGAVGLTSTSARVTGTVRPRGTATRVFFDLGTDGVSFPTSLEIAPVNGNLEAPVTAVFTDLIGGTGAPTYFYRVRAVHPTDGAEATGTARSLQIDVLLGLKQNFARPIPPTDRTGALQVNLLPAGTGAWRFVGETAWRPSGEAVTGLPTGERDIEFQPVPGSIQPARETVAIVSGEAPVVVERIYYTAAVPGDGGLRVLLEPAARAGAEIPVDSRAQWRLLGGTDPTWLNSGAAILNLPPGSYLVECKPIPGENTPPPANVVVRRGTTSLATITYLRPSAPTLNPPEVLSFQTVTTSQNLPFGYVGQIRSDRGSHSGFVVKPRVVATAAQVVIDEETLTAVTGVQWLLQRDKGTYEPEPQLPRGFYVFDDYAAQRQVESSPGVFGPASQNNNVAAMYFLEDAGRGGFSGFLASDELNNEFLESTDLKTLVGYPVNGISPAKQGRMHATPPTSAAFTRLPGESTPGSPFRLYSTTAIRGESGFIGGPLCVRRDGGSFYPAAIFLGGTEESLSRTIDSGVIDLFNRAEVSGNGGSNNTTGGITQTSAVTIGSESEPGALQVFIEPAGAVQAFGNWTISPSNTLRTSGTQQNGLTPADYILQFFPAPGFSAPEPQTVTVEGGQLKVFTYTYGQTRPGLAEFRQAIIDATGDPADAEDDADPDKDGDSNIKEFEAGTDPLDPLDFFETASTALTAAGFEVSVDGKAARFYELQLRNTTSGLFETQASQGPLAADQTITLTHIGASASSAIYRLRVTKIDP